jgi:Na+/melibiose symporter-like transporter
MRFRKLRIAWSIARGLLAVLLILLNVWSCWWWDRCYLQGTRTGVQINSDAGHVVLVIGPSEPTVNKVILGHLPSAGPADSFYDNDVLGFYFKRETTSLRLDIPYWFIALLVMAIAASPWLPWWSKRFSLRTLLIATTLVAVVLGVIVWLSRH